jgi:hypothetical protein
MRRADVNFIPQCKQPIGETNMSLEAKIAELTSAVQALTHVLLNPVDKEVAEAAQVFDPANQVEIVEVIDAHAEEIRAAVDEDAATEAAQPAVEVTYDDVKKATNNLSAAKGKEVTIGVLARFGVKRATELTQEQWSPYIEHAGKVTRGEADA